MDLRSITSAANGRRSKGPVTQEGRARSSQNARKHGLLASVLVLQTESVEAFELTHEKHIQRFQPVDETELEIVEEYTAAKWRLHRAWAIETRLLDRAAALETSDDPLDQITTAFSTRAESGALSLLYRYQARLDALSTRAIRRLHLLRTSFPTPPPGVAQPAVVASPVAEPEPQPQPEQPAAIAAPEPAEPAAAGPRETKPGFPNEPTFAPVDFALTDRSDTPAPHSSLVEIPLLFERE